MEAEELEKVKKDERKQRRENKLMEAQAELQCKEVGCGFCAQSKAGLVNHQRQRHRHAAQETLTCQYCSGQYKKTRPEQPHKILQTESSQTQAYRVEGVKHS